MREAMRGVVESGTATRLAVPGFDVGGKTGTAQLGTDRNPGRTPGSSASAARPARRPTIAVAVIVEGQPGASEQTGGRVAAPDRAGRPRGVPAGLTCAWARAARH